MEESTVKSRLIAYLDYKKISKSDFGREIGVSNAFVTSMRKGLQPDKIKSIASSYQDLNINWLLTGEGEMLKESNDNTSQNIDGKEGYITYLLPMRAMGGSLTGVAQDGVTLQNCEQVISPIKGIDFAITVYGESMAPEYPSGSRILIKQINPDLFIDWGKVYALDTPNGIVVKELRKSERDGYISCYSINPDPKFKPFDVPMCEIFGIYRVLMCLSAK